MIIEEASSTKKSLQEPQQQAGQTGELAEAAAAAEGCADEHPAPIETGIPGLVSNVHAWRPMVFVRAGVAAIRQCWRPGKQQRDADRWAKHRLRLRAEAPPFIPKEEPKEEFQPLVDLEKIYEGSDRVLHHSRLEEERTLKTAL